MAIAISRGLDTIDNCMHHNASVLIAKHSTLNRENERLAEIANVCKELSEKLTSNVSNISEGMGTIREANKHTDEKANNVHDLLSNVIEFCEGNDSLDAEGTKQLTQILTVTLEAFDQLNTSIKKSTGTTLSVDANILKIKSLVESINKTLTPNK